jgi:hypothetical protein
MILIKLAGVSMIFYCTILHLSKCNSSWAVSIKQNKNFNFQLPSTFIFLVFQKTVKLKVIHPSKICQNTKWHGPMVTGASSAFTSDVCMFCHFWDNWSYGIKIYSIEAIFNCTTSLPNFIISTSLFKS